MDTQSPWLDLRICLATVRVLLTGAGVEGHPDDDPLATPPEDGDPAERRTDPRARARARRSLTGTRSSTPGAAVLEPVPVLHTWPWP